MLKEFTIKCGSTEEMIMIRGTLKALGYTVYMPLDIATTFNFKLHGYTDYTGISLEDDGAGIFRSYQTYGQYFNNIEEFLMEHFKPAKSQAQLEFDKLQAQLEALQEQANKLKEKL